MPHVDEGTLHAYLDGEIPAGAKRRELEVHLISCASCRGALEEAKTLRGKSKAILSKSDPTPAAPAPPFEEIVARAEARATRPQVHRLSRMRALAWAATIVIAVGVGSVVTLQLRSPAEVQEATVTPSTPTRVAQEAEPPAASVARARDQLTDRRESQVVPAGPVPPEPADEQVAAADGGRRNAVEDAGVAGTGALRAAADAPEAELKIAAVVAESLVAESVDAGEAAFAQNRAFRAREAAPAAVDSVTQLRGVAQPVAAPVLEEARTDADAVTWTAVDQAAAARALGGEIATVDGLPVIGYAVRTMAARREVRVIQRTESGVELELVQWKTGEGDVSAGLASELDTLTTPGDSLTALTVSRNEYSIRARADLPEDVLRRLLDRIP